jgi:hypothetical protein
MRDRKCNFRRDRRARPAGAVHAGAYQSCARGLNRIARKGRALLWGPTHMFEDQRNRLLTSLDAAHDAYYRAEIFGGPSLHFHLRSLEAARAQDFERFAEYVYAVLASWGMHRMGPRGSKMGEFEEFRASLQTAWPAVLRLQERAPSDLNETDWSDLKTVFCKIRCMASGTSLVGNSKVMAHLLPHLISPVDREYTLKFLFRNGQITNGIEVEWKKLVQILEGFFYPIAQSSLFQSKAEIWLTHNDPFKWDTSPMKIVDNLLIGLSKMARAEQVATGSTPRVTGS